MALAAPGPLRWAAAGLLIGAAVLAASASARAENVFRFAFQGNLNTLDSVPVQRDLHDRDDEQRL
ncbi:hypothetical protein [Inquilinus ginsengisoli]|uniref:hypothetical protein n=1 Tax=Inquilinus ginsengisoli TaxID=363840 RepID=UPI003D1BF933